MTDTTLNRFISRGSAAQRAAFTPSIPTPASGPSQGYYFFEEDTNNFYAWNNTGTPGWVQLVAANYTNENAQDAVGGILVGLSYNDATPTIAVKRVVQIQVTDPAGSALTTGDAKAYFRVNAELNGYNLSAVAAAVTTVSSSGLPTVQIANVTDAVDMLSTKLTIDANETDSSTAATAAVIDTSKDDVATGDMLRIDVDVAGTGAKGLIVELTFTLP